MAGGQNAPPRGELTLSELGDPVQGNRDVVNLPTMREIGLPFGLPVARDHLERSRTLCRKALPAFRWARRSRSPRTRASRPSSRAS